MKLTTVIPILIGLAVGAFALRQFTQKPPPKPTYLVALADMAANQPIRTEWIGVAEWNEPGEVPKEYIRDMRVMASRFARNAIAKGKPLTEPDLWPFGVPSLLLAKLESNPNMRAVTVKVDAVSGGGGFVQPGNRVDVLATYGPANDRKAKTILQDVEVLAVNTMETPVAAEKDEKKSKATEPPRYVLLLLDPEDAESLSAVQTASGVQVQLLLRADNAITVQTRGASLREVMGWGSVAGGADQPAALPVASAPQPAPPAAEKQRPQAPQQFVEVFRGTKQSGRSYRLVNGKWVPTDEHGAGGDTDGNDSADAAPAEEPPPPPAGE